MMLSHKSEEGDEMVQGEGFRLDEGNYSAC